jgi:hypothetical protein
MMRKQVMRCGRAPAVDASFDAPRASVAALLALRAGRPRRALRGLKIAGPKFRFGPLAALLRLFSRGE